MKHEHLEEGKTYREAMIPSGELNRHRARRLSQDAEDALTLERWASFER